MFRLIRIFKNVFKHRLNLRGYVKYVGDLNVVSGFPKLIIILNELFKLFKLFSGVLKGCLKYLRYLKII